MSNIKKLVKKFLLYKKGEVISYIALCCVFIAIGFSAFLVRQGDIKQNYYSELSTIPKFPSSQIQDWVQNKIRDGFSIRNNKLFNEDNDAFLLDRKNFQKKENVRRWLRDFCNHNDYTSAFLVEPGSRKILLDTNFPDSKILDKDDSFDSLQSREVYLSDPHLSTPEKKLHFNLIISTTFHSAQNEKCFIVISVDPRKYIFNILNNSYQVSKTSEMYLIRKDGNHVLYLSNLRFASRSGSTLKIPLSDTRISAVKAVLNERGIVEGINYRGTKVLSNITTIKNFPWIIISEISLDEMNDEINAARNRILVYFVLIILVSGLVLLYVFYQERIRSLNTNKRVIFQNHLLERQYNNLIENSNDIILLVSQDGSILRANKNARKIYNYRQKELLQMKMDDIRLAKMTDKLNSQAEELEDNKGFVFENIHLKKDGTFIQVEESLHNVRIKNVNYQQNIIRDLTEKRKYEKELLMAQDLASMGKVANFLSHEIKSPLSGVKMCLDEMGTHSDISQVSKNRLSLISKRVESVLFLMDEVQHYSRNIKLDLHPIRIQNKIDVICRLIKSKNPEKKINFINSVDNIQLVIDPQEIEILLIKVIENSVEAINNSGTIEIYSSIESDSNFEIFIKDSGDGIKEPEKIFEPFFSTKTTGTGFGLPLAKKIIKNHNGDIQLVSSKVGETIFRITFPLIGFHG